MNKYHKHYYVGNDVVCERGEFSMSKSKINTQEDAIDCEDFNKGEFDTRTPMKRFIELVKSYSSDSKFIKKMLKEGEVK